MFFSPIVKESLISRISLRDCFNEDFSDWLETSNYIGDIDDKTEDVS